MGGEYLNIRYYRKKAGLRQVDLAKKMHVDQAAVSNWELGKCVPQRKLHKRLAKTLGCTVGDLLKGDDNEEI